MSKGSLTQTIAISADLTPEAEAAIVGVLCKNEDIFSYGARDIPGVACTIIQHKLVVIEGVKPRKQKLRHMSTNRQEAAKAEATNLLKDGVIQEIKHPEWLANPVLVRKANCK